MQEISLNYEDMVWEEALSYPSGTKIKVLREENGVKTFLLKLLKGFDMEAHCHTAITEQHFVLDGRYESDGKKYHKGSYRLIPGGTTHGPFTSEDGAIILIIWGK